MLTISGNEIKDPAVDRGDRLAYTLPEFAAAIRISLRQVYREMKAGRLDTFQIGARTLIDPSAARRYIAARIAEGKRPA
jgi:hypothetical protein